MFFLPLLIALIQQILRPTSKCVSVPSSTNSPLKTFFLFLHFLETFQASSVYAKFYNRFAHNGFPTSEIQNKFYNFRNFRKSSQNFF